MPEHAIHRLTMSRYRELTAKVDTFFERVQARHGADMQCGSSPFALSPSVIRKASSAMSKAPSR